MKILFSLMPFLILLCISGCTSVSVKLDQEAEILHEQKMPVKFNFSTISWNTTTGFPKWLSEQQISDFISNIKARAPELFSDDAQAIPMTFYFNHKRTSTTNGGVAFLAMLTCFTIIPGVLTYEDQFDVKIQIGDKKQYTENYSFKIYERGYVSFIPFFALFLPSQSGNFCSGFIDINNKVVKTPQLQNIFLNMIYQLNKDKLRMLYDDKYGEEVELLNSDE